MDTKWGRSLGGPPLRAGLWALVFTGAATFPAALPGIVSTTVAALGYVLAVVAASATGGTSGGLAASVLSFLALNFFFTPPLHTLSVGKTEDLVALVVFLVVAVVVGALLARAVEQRGRAERREREALLLQHLNTRLLSGEPVHDVLESFASSMVELFDLARCEVSTGPATVVSEGTSQRDPGEPETIPIEVGGREVGGISATPYADHVLAPDERSVIRTFAGQMGLALEGMRLAEEAGDARVEAERNRLRAALFSSVTHDLRTPLASITASVTSLLDPALKVSPADREELLDTIRQEAGRLNGIVGNLLDLSRIRAGALLPQKEPTPVDEVVEGVVARLQPMLDGREIRLLIRENLPDVPVDVTRIEQVLTNVLENAARFSPERSAISVSAARWQDRVQVRVADRGAGIPPDQRERVFEPFIKSDDSTGTGLGLSIARPIIEAHGGRMWIEGTPGGGTTVVFELPLKS